MPSKHKNILWHYNTNKQKIYYQWDNFMKLDYIGSSGKRSGFIVLRVFKRSPDCFQFSEVWLPFLPHQESAKQLPVYRKLRGKNTENKKECLIYQSPGNVEPTICVKCITVLQANVQIQHYSLPKTMLNSSTEHLPLLPQITCKYLFL